VENPPSILLPTLYKKTSLIAYYFNFTTLSSKQPSI